MIHEPRERPQAVHRTNVHYFKIYFIQIVTVLQNDSLSALKACEIDLLKEVCF